MSLLEIKDLSVSYGDRDMISGINMSVEKGDIVCLAGESGCGKSTLLKSIMNLPVLQTEITKGEIIFDGVNVDDIPLKERLRSAGTHIGMVQQNPNGAFNPLRTYKAQFAETMKSHDMEYDEDKILRAFESLNLSEGERILKSRPYEMSGGMNQRIVIAMSMLLKPKLLLCDEPTSALDVTTQKQVIEEIMKLRDENDTAVLLVTHNMGVVSMMADHVGIMYAGHIVEYGEKNKVLKCPAHPYTGALLSAIPDFSFKLPKGLDGQPPLNGAVMRECAFMERCAFKHEECRECSYELKEIGAGHKTACEAGRADRSVITGNFG